MLLSLGVVSCVLCRCLRGFNCIQCRCRVDRCLGIIDSLCQSVPVGLIVVVRVLTIKECVEVVLRGRLRIRKLLRFGLHRVHGVNRSVLCRGNGIGRSRILDSGLAVCDCLVQCCPVIRVVISLGLAVEQRVEISLGICLRICQLLRLRLDGVHSGDCIRLCRGYFVNRGCSVDIILAVCDCLVQSRPVVRIVVGFGLSGKQCVKVSLRGGLRIRQLIADSHGHRVACVVRIIARQANLHAARIQAGYCRTRNGCPCCTI